MTTEDLRKKTGRYLCGLSVPAERRQIQNWLSCTIDNKSLVSTEEREIIENEILAQVQAYVVSSLFHFPPKREPWWNKITAFF